MPPCHQPVPLTPPTLLCAGCGAAHAGGGQSRDCGQRTAAPPLHPECLVRFRWVCWAACAWLRQPPALAHGCSLCSDTRLAGAECPDAPVIACRRCRNLPAAAALLLPGAGMHGSIGQANYATAKAGVVSSLLAALASAGGMRCGGGPRQSAGLLRTLPGLACIPSPVPAPLSSNTPLLLFFFTLSRWA